MRTDYPPVTSHPMRVTCVKTYLGDQLLTEGWYDSVKTKDWIESFQRSTIESHHPTVKTVIASYNLDWFSCVTVYPVDPDSLETVWVAD